MCSYLKGNCSFQFAIYLFLIVFKKKHRSLHISWFWTPPLYWRLNVHLPWKLHWNFDVTTSMTNIDALTLYLEWNFTGAAKQLARRWLARRWWSSKSWNMLFLEYKNGYRKTINNSKHFARTLYSMHAGPFILDWINFAYGSALNVRIA